MRVDSTVKFVSADDGETLQGIVNEVDTNNDRRIPNFWIQAQGRDYLLGMTDFKTIKPPKGLK